MTKFSGVKVCDLHGLGDQVGSRIAWFRIAGLLLKQKNTSEVEENTTQDNLQHP